MGAFYTDASHCKDLANYFNFSETEETTVLEPSIGDGTAVELVTKAKENSKIKIFGVELNGKVASQTKEKSTIEVCLEADFLEGVRIRNNAFAFCFGNPPYLEDDLTGGERERTEKQFLEKVTNYLIRDGLLCWIIPYHIFLDRSNFRFLVGHYDILNVLRFRESEYKKYKQVAIIARKVESRIYLRDELDKKMASYPLDSIPVLSDKAVATYEVPVIPKEQVTLFCSKVFDAEEAFKVLEDLGTSERFSDLRKYHDSRFTTPKFVVNNLGKPPIPLKKDSLYLLATSGSGQGLTGSEQTRDLHLQRGVAEVIEESTYVPNDDSSVVEKVVKRTKVTMTIIENDGKITVLE